MIWAFVIFPAALAVQQGVCPAGSGTGSLTIRDSAGIRIVENRAPRAALMIVVEPPLLQLGAGASNVSLASVVGATRLSNGNVIVLSNAGDAAIFDGNGRFLEPLGGIAKWRGEIQELSSILRLPGDTLLIADSPRRKLAYLTATGELVRTAEYPLLPARQPTSARMPPTPTQVKFIARFADGSYLASTIHTLTAGEARNAPPVRGRTLHLHRLDSSRAKFDTVMRAALQPTFFGAGSPPLDVPFASFVSVAAGPDGFVQATGERDEIIQYDPSARVVGLIRNCEAPEAVTSSEIERWRAQYVSTALPEYRALFEANARAVPIPPFKAAITQLVIDAVGRVWARGNARYGDQAMWSVFASTGAFQGTVVVPAGVRVSEIGADYLMGYLDSPFGTNGLRIYTLRK